MRKLLIFFLLIVSFFTLLLPAFARGAGNIDKKILDASHAPRELLVKFKPSFRPFSKDYYKILWDMDTLRSFDHIGVQKMKIPEGMTLEEALEILRDDPDVEYAEPNYYYRITAPPDDTFFENLWGLHNTGQSVNGTSGTPDADMDGPEAWDITTGSSDVVVAVIDSGLDYNHPDFYHPDLSTNIWTNPDEIPANNIDDDGNGYPDDWRGWDFVDDDNDPMDPLVHGTHVAGIIAAVGNNSTGVSGLNWNVKIMVLKIINAFGFATTDLAISALNYANAKGAHVINASWGSTASSKALQDAIDASSALVVCAAGNNGSDNDVTPYYPASYESPHIISVAATDQKDNLASFSNYGAASVDVAAPGVNILSTSPGRQTVWSDNFDDNDISDWTTGGTNNTWGPTNSLSFSGAYSLTDSPSGDYQNGTASWAQVPVLNLSSHSGAKLEFKLSGISETGVDSLRVQVTTDSSDWENKDQDVLIGGIVYRAASGNFSSNWFNSFVDLGQYDGMGTVYLRFYFATDSSITRDGWYIDDITVTAAAASYNGTEYRLNDGTSMAAPHVSGLAALIKARISSLTNTEIKAVIESSVDRKDSLSTNVATGGRINAHQALIPPEEPTNLTLSTTSPTQIDLSWTDNSTNEMGFRIERKTGSGDTYSELDTVAADTTSYSDTGLSNEATYYYRVHAYNLLGDSGYSNESTVTTLIATSTSSGGGGGGGGGGGCFIGTAAYGSLMAPQVKILRDFRDRFLLTSAPGRSLVEFYYTHSPPLARFISGHSTLKTLVRWSLLPVIGWSWISLQFGPWATLLLFLLSIMMVYMVMKSFSNRHGMGHRY